MDVCVNELEVENGSHNPLRSLPGAEEFAELYEAHSKAVYYVALRFLSDPQKAEDVTHEVFLKAFHKLNDFRGESSVRTWLYRITINHCQNLKRSWHARNIVTSLEDDVSNVTSEVAPSPSRVLETKELGERIQITLAMISEEYRLLLLLVADNEMSYDEIATLTEQTADAVRGKIHRARKAFAVQFAKTA